MSNDEDINATVCTMRNQMLMDYCSRRINEGASREQVNEELQGYIPEINAWSRRQRTVMKLMQQ